MSTSQPHSPTTEDQIGVGPTFGYTYPDGRTIGIPPEYRHLEHLTPGLLISWLEGADLSTHVVISLDGLSRCGSGRYRKPGGRYPHPSRDEYYEGICRTDVDLDGIEGLVNPRLLTDSALAMCLTEPLGYTCEVGVYGPGLVGDRRRIYRPIARRKDNWLGGQIIGMDLDGTPGDSALERALEVCDRHGLWPSFAYDSGSCTCDEAGVHDRIRLVFILDRFITEPGLMDGLVQTTAGLFGADAHAVDRARVLYGGRSVIHAQFGSRVTPNHIIAAGWEDRAATFTGTKDSLRVAKSRYQTQFRDFSVGGASERLEEAQGAGDDNGYGAPLTIYKGCNTTVNSSEGSPGGVDPHPTPIPTPCPTGCPADGAGRPQAVQVRKFQDKLRSQCRLWCDLVAGSADDGVGEGDPRWLYYAHLLHLFSNLTAIVGGQRAFERILREAHARHPNWHQYNPHGWGRHKRDSLTAGPSRCTPERCRHHADCVHRGRTIVDAVRGYLGEAVVELCDHPTVGLSEGERLLDLALGEALTADDDRVHPVGGPTGIGKTRRLFLYIRSHPGRYLVAVPTHRLGDEELARMTELGVAAAKRPPTPLETLPPGEEREALQHLYDIGASDRAHIRIRERADDVPQYREYLEGCRAAEEADVMIVTHAALVRMLVGDEVGDRRIVIDEDPFLSLVRVGATSLQLVRDMATSPPWDPDPTTDAVLGTFLDDLAAGEPMTIRPTPRVPPESWEAVVRRAISRIGPERPRTEGGVLDLLRSNHHVVSADGTVTFSSRVNLPERGLVILSATADAEVCKLLFGDRVVVHDVPDVSGVGRIVQHPGSSVSRHRLSTMEPEERERFVAAVGSAPTITYAAFKHLFENPSELHFGNLEGRDILGGCDLNIVGTHNLNPVALHLMAAELGRTEPRMATQRQTVNWYDGYAWSDYCYADDPLLLLLQNFTRYSMLYQAIGRARALRNDCTVTVWTGVPIRGAERVGEGADVENPRPGETDR